LFVFIAGGKVLTFVLLQSRMAEQLKGLFERHPLVYRCEFAISFTWELMVWKGLYICQNFTF